MHLIEGLEFSPSYVPDVTSYDYDAPLTESGQYTAKYNALANTKLMPVKREIEGPWYRDATFKMKYKQRSGLGATHREWRREGRGHFRLLSYMIDTDLDADVDWSSASAGHAQVG